MQNFAPWCSAHPLHAGISDTKIRRLSPMSAGLREELMTDAVHGAAPQVTRVNDAYRWMQLAVGVGAMVMIANYQYGGTFFFPHIQKTFRCASAFPQTVFST